MQFLNQFPALFNMLIRFFDILFSLIGLILISPFFIIICIIVLLDSKGSIFYIQKRVGKNNIDFNLLKFRTMYSGSDKSGLLTIGNNDKRITSSGYFLRKYKLDELPQLINVLLGEMSIVGPRPEVRKYVDLYSEEQKKILNIRPGVTDYASVEYFSENEILKNSDNPEQIYVNEILPKKIKLNLKYIDNPNPKKYFSIIYLTAKAVFTKQ
jgi:lipopolysaccharide/colanic/teichoic acid biosynthesis glycosyltransferase